MDEDLIQEQLVEAYTEVLKLAYVQMRRKWRPDIRGVGSEHDHRFKEVAKILSENKLDPYEYVRFVEQYITSAQPDVYPNQITSIALAEDFVKCKPEIDEITRLQIRLYADKLKCRLTNGFTLEEALLDKYNDFSPAFSFAMAYSKEEFGLADKFREAAKRQFMFEPLLREILGAWIPEEFK